MASKQPADREAIERAAEAKKQMAADLLAKANLQRDEIRSLMAEAQSLISTALARLDGEGRPGMELIEVYVPRQGVWRVLGQASFSKVGSYPLLEYSWKESRHRRAGIGWVRLLASHGYLVAGTDAYTLLEFGRKVAKHEGLARDAKVDPFEPFSLPTFRQIVGALSTMAAPTLAVSEPDAPRADAPPPNAPIPSAPKADAPKPADSIAEDPRADAARSDAPRTIIIGDPDRHPRSPSDLRRRQRRR